MRSYPGMRKIKAATAFEGAEHIVPQLTPFLGKGGSFLKKKKKKFVSGCTVTLLPCAGSLVEVHRLRIVATSLAVEQGL